jgi:predicted metal-dependent hydrolase
MSRKSAKIDALLAGFKAGGLHDPHYAGYFACFNRQLYYEAHDVLEELWLERRQEPQAGFYQGLIQLAGAFVHLQKGRLRPAGRLFALALKKLEPYPSINADLDLEAVRRLCREHCRALERDGYRQNPWSPERAPTLKLIHS